MDGNRPVPLVIRRSAKTPRTAGRHGLTPAISVRGSGDGKGREKLLHLLILAVGTVYVVGVSKYDSFEPGFAFPAAVFKNRHRLIIHSKLQGGVAWT